MVPSGSGPLVPALPHFCIQLHSLGVHSVDIILHIHLESVRPVTKYITLHSAHQTVTQNGVFEGPLFTVADPTIQLTDIGIHAFVSLIKHIKYIAGNSNISLAFTVCTESAIVLNL